MPMLQAFLNIISLGVLDFSPGADSNVKATALKTHKTCTGCKAVKPLDGFGKRKAQCKVCISAYNEKRYAKPSVKAAAKAASKARYATPEGKAAAAAHYARPEVKAAAKARNATAEGKAYQKKINDERKADPARNAADLKQKREHNASKRATPEGLVKNRSDARIGIAMRDSKSSWGPLGEDLPRNAAGCDESTFNLLDIVSWAFYVVYLKGTIYGGMVWPVFHIDHIRPLSSFDLNDPEQRIMAFHYTNTRLLTAEDNWKKNDKYTEATHPLRWDGAKWVLKAYWELKDENDKYGLNKYRKVARAAKRRKTGIAAYFKTK